MKELTGTPRGGRGVGPNMFNGCNCTNIASATDGITQVASTNFCGVTERSG
jgi:hypothetical protein